MTKVKKYKIAGTFAYAEKKRQAKVEDLDRFRINTTLEMHILRHFSQISENYKKALLGEKYIYFDHSNGIFKRSIVKDYDIEEALKTIGSKFYPNLKGLESPKEILKFIEENLYRRVHEGSLELLKYGGNTKIMMRLKYNTYVGDVDCISVSELSPGKRKQIIKQNRSSGGDGREAWVNTIKDIDKEKTRKIAIILHKNERLPFYFVTAYPGNLSPDFGPHKELEKEFEDNQVFII